MANSRDGDTDTDRGRDFVLSVLWSQADGRPDNAPGTGYQTHPAQAAARQRGGSRERQRERHCVGTYIAHSCHRYRLSTCNTRYTAQIHTEWDSGSSRGIRIDGIYNINFTQLIAALIDSTPNYCQLYNLYLRLPSISHFGRKCSHISYLIEHFGLFPNLFRSTWFIQNKFLQYQFSSNHLTRHFSISFHSYKRILIRCWSLTNCRNGKAYNTTIYIYRLP